MELHHRGTETQSFIMHKNGPTRPWVMWEKYEDSPQRHRDTEFYHAQEQTNATLVMWEKTSQICATT